MWNGKKKAVTFSFDDGVTQDIRLIKMFDKYGLKGTFNLNSGFLGLEGTLFRNGRTVRHDKVELEKIKEVYHGHEVAVHTLTHPNLTGLEAEEIIKQVEEDRRRLSLICGYEVVSMAYPCGGVNNDDRVAEIIRNNTGVRFARGLDSTYSFDLQQNLLRFKPTVYYIEDCLDEIVVAIGKVACHNHDGGAVGIGEGYAVEPERLFDRVGAAGCHVVRTHDADMACGVGRYICLGVAYGKLAEFYSGQSFGLFFTGHHKGSCKTKNQDKSNDFFHFYSLRVF